MIGTRHEEYTHFDDELPFFLQIGLNRTPGICSKEQNWHENLEIQFCTDGEGEVLLNGEKYAFKRHDCIVVNSNVIHYTGTTDRLTYTCLIISADFCKQMGIDYDRLQFSPHIRSERLRLLLEQLTDAYLQDALPLRTAKLHAIVLELLITLAGDHATVNPLPHTKQRAFENVKGAINYIRENYARKMSLDEIAKAAYTDKFALCRDFKKLAGQTVVTYIHQYRCQQAATHLRDGCTVAETAGMCGFENLSFFTKTFKKYMGALPSKYKGV